MLPIQSDMRCDLLQIAYSSSTSFAIRSLNPIFVLSRAAVGRQAWSSSWRRWTTSCRLRAFSTDAGSRDGKDALKVVEKPSICTADELHYVSVPSSDWRLALWRYYPPPNAPQRNHPLLLLSGVGTNAIGYDLSAESSFARYMSGQGFETWILEVRGAGLSVHASNSKEIEQSAHAISDQIKTASESPTIEALSAEQQSNYVQNAMGSETSATETQETGASFVEQDLRKLATVGDESRLVTRLTETLIRLSERVSGFLTEGQSRIMSDKLLDQISKLLVDSQLSESFNEIREKLFSLLETRQNSAIASQIRELTQRLVIVVEDAQRSVSPPLFDLQERLVSTVEDFQKQLDLIVKYDWDFDNYLEEDIPAAIEYIRVESKPKDGKLLAIGHSMGGILLYAMLSRCGFEGRDSNLAAVVTLASSLDYRTSKSTLKLLLPLADPAQALNVPVVPLGALLSATYPLTSRPPYALSWLNQLISAEDMMHPELLEKLILNNFCTIPAKLMLQLATAFREGGLCDRKGKFFYKDHLHKSKVPVLALAGDLDLICPPQAVEDTIQLIPKDLVTYKVFGEPGGPHYAHYDLVGGRLAMEQVYPCIVQFLTCYDST